MHLKSSFFYIFLSRCSWTNIQDFSYRKTSKIVDERRPKIFYRHDSYTKEIYAELHK